MNKRNNGLTEVEILQNHFTAFITKSIRRARIDYLKQETFYSQHTCNIEEKMPLISEDSNFVLDICKSNTLANAINQLDEREKYVLVARVIHEKDFEEIGDSMGLKYKGVTAIYYRTIKKLKDILGGM